MAFIQSVRGFTPQIGEDCFLAVNATVVGDVVLGDGCSVWFNAVLRGDVNSIRIGRNVNIQDGSILHTLYQKSTIEIGDNVSIGHNVTLHGCHIRDYALIGMGSVVLAKTIIEPYSLYAGTPAKFIKKVSPEQSKELNERIANNYQMYASWFDKEENPQP